jgi:hypothetical protein
MASIAEITRQSVLEETDLRRIRVCMSQACKLLRIEYNPARVFAMTCVSRIGL